MEPDDSICNFFNSSEGCFMGAACRFVHQKPILNSDSSNQRNSEKKEEEFENVVKTVRGFTLKLKKKLINNQETENDHESIAMASTISASKPLDSSKDRKIQRRREPVKKPQPKTLESLLERCTSYEERASVMKGFQVDQLLRRYSGAVRKTTPQGMDYITFEMKPSDPDFAFDLEQLKLVLNLNRYPSTRDAHIIVMNSEIPSDLKLNIQKAFSKQQEIDANASLLDLFKWLDKNLESLLIAKKKSPNERDIGIVAFVKPSEASESARRAFYEGESVEDDQNNDDNEENIEQISDVDNDEFTNKEEEEEPNIDELQLHDTTTLINKGTSIRFVNLNLENISLLTPYSLSITVKCNRCKNLQDFPHIKPNGDGKSDWASQACHKCNALLLVNFRPDLVHFQNSQLGYLDCVECSLEDIHRFKFLATCDQCGAIQIPNSCFETICSSIHCRECHGLMILNASQFRFVTIQPANQGISSAAIAAAQRGKKLAEKKRKREGISIGNPLPNKGVCAHYKKSYRWFRFPCCGKLFPCDICHEKGNNDGHVMEWATRQICGFCSREQPYSQSKPCLCGKDMVKKDIQGFWEGGKGTRDRVKMNRNDSHKFKGIGKTMSNRAKDKLAKTSK